MPLAKIRAATFTDDELIRIKAAAATLKTARLQIDDKAGRTSGEILAIARRAKRRWGSLALVGVDSRSCASICDNRAMNPSAVFARGES